MSEDREVQLHRVTVNLTPRSDAALEQAVAITRDNKTDTINRALQVYAWVLAEQAGGSQVIVRNKDNMTFVLVPLL